MKMTTTLLWNFSSFVSNFSIQEDHAKFVIEGGKIYLEKTSANGRMLLNGEPITQRTQLQHNDRLMFGTTQLYVFCHPKERDSSKTKYPTISYESAQQEIAERAGFDMNSDNKSRGISYVNRTKQKRSMVERNTCLNKSFSNITPSTFNRMPKGETLVIPCPETPDFKYMSSIHRWYAGTRRPAGDPACYWWSKLHLWGTGYEEAIWGCPGFSWS